MTMLIDDRTPPPDDGERAPVEPNWRLWGWLAVAAVVAFAAAHADGFIGYVLLCGAFAAGCKAAAAVVSYADGLREWRQ